MRWGWMERAACIGLWHVMDAENPPASGLEVEVARGVCRGCAVRVECLSWVLALPGSRDPGGTVAGTCPVQRRAMRRSVQRARVG